MTAEGIDKTTFTCQEGGYLYNRMPLGLTDSLETFQRTLDITLSVFKWKIRLVYLDDFIVFY